MVGKASNKSGEAAKAVLLSGANPQIAKDEKTTRPWCRASLAQQPLKAIEDQIETKVEGGGFIVGFRSIFHRNLGQGRICAWWDSREDFLCRFGGVRIITERETGPLPLESVDVAVEREKRVCGCSWGESGLKQCAEDAIRVGQAAWTTPSPGVDEPGGPSMMREDLPCGDCPAPHRLLPVYFTGREVDLGHDEINHAVQEIVLSGDMVIERCRFYSEPST